MMTWSPGLQIARSTVSSAASPEAKARPRLPPSTRGHGLFQRGPGRVGRPAVLISGAQPAHAVLLVGGHRVDRRHDGPGVGVGFLTCVNGQRLESLVHTVNATRNLAPQSTHSRPHRRSARSFVDPREQDRVGERQGGADHQADDQQQDSDDGQSLPLSTSSASVTPRLASPPLNVRFESGRLDRTADMTSLPSGLGSVTVGETNRLVYWVKRLSEIVLIGWLLLLLLIDLLAMASEPRRAARQCDMAESRVRRGGRRGGAVAP